MGASLTSEMSRSPSSQFPHSPIDIPPIDPMAVMELEMAAKRVADNVDLLMGNLRSNLHKVRVCMKSQVLYSVKTWLNGTESHNFQTCTPKSVKVIEQYTMNVDTLHRM